ncbi:MAG: hypothetical protein ACI4WP_01115 [Bacilli bacterium]
MNKKTIEVVSNNEGKIREIKEKFKDYEILPIKEIKGKNSQKYLPKLEKIIFV